MQKNILIAVVLLVLLAGLSVFFLRSNAAQANAPESATQATTTNDTNHELGDAGVPDQAAATPPANKPPQVQQNTNTNNSAKTDAPQSQKRLVVRFVNQYGETIRGTFPALDEPLLYDSVGEAVNGHFWGSGSNSKQGLREFDKDIVPGSYVVKWKTTWLLSNALVGNSVERQLEAGEAKITVPNNGNWAVTVTVPQKQISYLNGGMNIHVTLKNQAGTPLQIAFGQGSVVITNAQGTKVGGSLLDEGSGGSGTYRVAHDVIAQEGATPGQYTMTLTKTGYVTKTVTYTLPDVSSWTDAAIIAKQPGTIDLGTVVLEKK